jgi:miniconductance mechanosensitive channel
MFEDVRAWVDAHPQADFALTLGLLLIGSALAYFASLIALRKSTRYFLRHTAFRFPDEIVEGSTLARLAYIVPALILYNFSHLLPAGGVTERVLASAVIFFALLALGDALTTANTIYARLDASRARPPIKGYLQIAKLLLYLFGTIAIIATMLDRSPWVVLSGLGAATAVVLLIFRDTLLSFVASIQIATNDLIRIGDYIEMPQVGASGEVLDIALHTVKVRNDDLTITLIPTHKMVEESFKNWRGIAQAGSRRIKRSIFIDQRSVRLLDDALLERLSRVSLLSEYLAQERGELAREAANKAAAVPDPLNDQRLTNLGTFRAYLVRFLKNHPKIRTDLALMVRHLQPTAEGLPVEIYAYSKESSWEPHENIQADLLDHVLAVLPEFGLRIFQNPS